MLPGPHGGTAIAEVLLGRTSPSGRLPLTYPKLPGLQVQHWHRVTQLCNSNADGGLLTASTMPCPVEWPFGAGLSYAAFQYSQIGVPDSLVTHRLGAPGR